MEGLSMRAWMIVLSSAVGAIAAAGALAVPELLNASRSEIGPILLPHLPALAVTILAVYALCAMLLTTATLVAGTLRLRYHLSRTTPDRAPPRRDWVAAFGANGFRQLAPRLAPTLAQSARADGSVVVLQTRFNPNETRREIGRLLYISLARSHFYSALIVLAGAVGLGLAQDHGSLSFLSGAIPTTSAILILVGLVLLAILGRIAIDVTVEPLLETISQLPAERVEVALLRRAVELLEMACNTPAAGDDRGPALPPQGELVTVIEQGHHALLDAVGRLSANTQALGAAVRSSVETLETTMRTTAAQQQPTNENRFADVGVFPELQAAVEELTAVLQRLSALPEDAEETAPGVDPVSRRRTPAPHLARELRKLLQEIEAVS
jgi:hypothetical protein